MEKASLNLERFKVRKKKHNEKGRPPLNGREEILDKVAKLTGTTIPRWCKWDEQLLRRAYENFQELNRDGHIRNKAAYLTFLLKEYQK